MRRTHGGYPITFYDRDQNIVGMFDSSGEAIPAAASNVGNHVPYWDDKLACFVLGEVVWDGARPDAQGGFTKGELLDAMTADDATKWRLIGAPLMAKANHFRGAGKPDDPSEGLQR